MIKLFVDRPVLSSAVLALVLLGGIIGITVLPLNQYPDITPPVVKVSATLPGASADIAKQSVATILEQQLNGTPRMQYMESSCSNTGSVSISLTFEAGVNQDIAAVDVQNKVKAAEARLPMEVVQEGVSVEKEASTFLMMIAVHSDREEYDYAYLSNFSTTNILDFLKRVPGVGRVSNMASRYYSMRIWLNPLRMAGLGITVDDVKDAIKEQNTDSAAGAIGTQPSMDDTMLSFPLITTGRLETVKEFEEIILRATPDGAMVKLKDIADVKLGSSDYNKTSSYNGKESTSLGVFLLPDANPVSIARQIRKILEENSKDFPEGLEYTILFDYGNMIEMWLTEVAKGTVLTILIALAALALFLRSIRATMVFVFILPVIFIGSFGLFGVFGVGINMLSVLASIFAVAFALDDILLIVYRTRQLLAEKLTPKQAALKAAQKQAPTILVTAFLLIAVYGVIGFMAGLPGKLYREFAYGLAIFILVSSLLSVSIVPAFCGAFLKPKDAKKIAVSNGMISKLSLMPIRLLVKVPLFGLIAWAAVTAGAYQLNSTLPTEFLPEEDQGFVIGEVILPDGATFQRTAAVMTKMEDYYEGHPAVESILSIEGVSARVGNIDSRGHFLLMLKPWSQRPDYSAEAIMGKSRIDLMPIPEAVTFLFNPPTIPGLGSGGGFLLMVQDRTGRNFDGLVETTQTIIDSFNASPVIGEASTNLQASIPQIKFSVDEQKAKVLGVALKDIYSTCANLLTSANVNDFNLKNRVYRVKIQAKDRFRKLPANLNQYHVRSSDGQMIPIISLADIEFTSGPGSKKRYNMFDAVTILGRPAEGYSSGQAIKEAERILSQSLPSGFGFQWSGVTFEEIQASKQVGPILLLSLIFVLILLAARFENWAAPLAVLTIIPVGLFGALLAISTAKIANGLYFQISMLALTGLAIKQASVTVSYIKDNINETTTAKQAALDAINQRAKPVLLISFAFAIGLVPFITARGAGAATRQIFTTGVAGGLLAVAVLGLGIVPCFAYIIFELQNKLFKRTREIQTHEEPQNENDAQ